MKPASKSIIKAQEESSLLPTYTGGIGVLDTSGKEQSPNPDDLVLTHVHLGFEGMGMDDGDFVGMAVLGSILGGGGSFSAGGVSCATFIYYATITIVITKNYNHNQNLVTNIQARKRNVYSIVYPSLEQERLD